MSSAMKRTKRLADCVITKWEAETPYKLSRADRLKLRLHINKALAALLRRSDTLVKEARNGKE